MMPIKNDTGQKWEAQTAMNERHDRLVRWMRRAGVLLLLVWALPACAAPQDDEPTVRERSLWNKRFQEARKNNKSAPTSTGQSTQHKTQQFQKTPKTPKAQKTAKPSHAVSPAAGAGDELIGVTFWRLRPAPDKGAAHDPRLVVSRAGGQFDQFIADRVSARHAFREGDLVRVGIEVARETNGYLYVINREIYADGSLSEPYLLFPSSTTPAGQNVVTAGRIVYLPADSDKLPYFTIQRHTEKPQVGEKLTIIVSPEPLSPRGQTLKIDDRTEIIRLDSAQTAEWERAWGGAVEQHETKGQLVKVWTMAEKRAGEGTALSEDDPLPQMIYRVKTRSGAPAVAHVTVRIAE